MTFRTALGVAAVLVLAFAVARGEGEPTRLAVLGPDGRPVDRVLATRGTLRFETLPVFDPTAPAEVHDAPAGVLDPTPPGPEGGWVLLWGPELAPVVVPTEGEAIGVRLAATRPLRGRVRFERGTPAVGLEVFAMRPTGRGAAHRARTDESGSFAFAHTSAGAWRVVVRRGDGRIQDLGVFEAGEAAVGGDLPAASAVVGLILDADQSGRRPVPDLALEVRGLPSGAPGAPAPRRAVTGADGTWRIADLAPGTYELHVADGAFDVVDAPFRFEVDRPIRLRLPTAFVRRRRTVTGRVMDPERRGLPGVDVTLLPGESSESGEVQEPVGTRTDASGRFALDGVMPGEGHRLLVRATGYAPLRTDPFGVGTSGSVAVPDIVLTPGWTLAVQARRPGGGAPEGVRVTVLPAGLTAPGDEALWSLVARAVAENGVATIEDLPNSDVRVRAEAPGYLAVEEVVRRPGLGDERTWQPTLFEAPTLTGQVVYPGGRPARDVWVAATPRDGSGERTRRTGADGRFVFLDLPQVPTDLAVRASTGREGLALTQYEGAVPGGEELLLLLEPGLSVSGSLSGHRLGGGPVYVSLEAATFDADTEQDRWRTARHVTLDPSVHPIPFRLAGIPAGAYALRASQGGVDSDAVPVWLDAEDVTRVELVLPDAGRVAGVVVTPEGEPLLGAQVRLVRLRGDGQAPGRVDGALRQATGRDGGYVFDEVAPGLWRLEAEDEDVAARHATVEVGEGESVVAEDLVLSAGGAVEGRVTDVSGTALDGTLLLFTAIEEGVPPARVRTGVDGHYRVDHVAPGLWRVRVEGGFDALADLEAVTEVFEGKTTRLDLVPAGRGGLEGIVSSEGRPVGGVPIRLLSFPFRAGDPVRQWRTVSGGDGRYAFGGLEGGPYVLEAEYGAARIPHRLHLRDGDQATVDLELFGGRLPGTVSTGSGRPVSGATVWALQGRERIGQTRTRPDGRFLLLGLPPGVYDLHVFRPGLPPGRALGVRADLPGSEEEAEIVLGVGGTLQLRVEDETGRGLTGARITLLDATGRPLHGGVLLTAPGGRLDIEGVPAGTVGVQVHAPRRGRGARTSVQIREGRTTPLEVVVGPPSVLGIRIEITGRDPALLVRVTLRRGDTGEIVAERRPAARFVPGTDLGYVPGTGVLAIDDLGPGPYEVFVEAGPRYVPATIPLTLESGQDRSIRVLLEAR